MPPSMTAAGLLIVLNRTASPGGTQERLASKSSWLPIGPVQLLLVCPQRHNAPHHRNRA